MCNDADARNEYFDIVFSIKYCVGMFHHFYQSKYEEELEKDDFLIISKDKHRRVEVRKLNIVCSMMLLSCGHWHCYLKITPTNPLEP